MSHGNINTGLRERTDRNVFKKEKKKRNPFLHFPSSTESEERNKCPQSALIHALSLGSSDHRILLSSNLKLTIEQCCCCCCCRGHCGAQCTHRESQSVCKRSQSTQQQEDFLRSCVGAVFTPKAEG